MFTGIIESVGTLAGSDRRGGDLRLYVRTGGLPLGSVRLGDSIATNGVCLTVVGLPGDGFISDVSVETTSLTTLGGLSPGSPVNLERALTLNTPLGGHLVSGHVDGMGRVLKRRNEGRSIRFDMAVPPELARYIAHKGSVCVDGVSLTVNGVDGNRFELNIVPHTSQETIISGYRKGTVVNIEVDLVARYLERLLTHDSRLQRSSDSELTLEMLARYGFAEN